MLERIDFVLDAAKGYTYEQFSGDKIRFAAVSYGTLVIGEAAYMLSKEFKESHPATPWRQIEGMRHHIVHGYFQVRPDMIWNVMQNDLLPLRQQVEQYLAEADGQQ